MSADLADTDGVLYKWTNYWGGWQPRWFELSNGILAYYSSYEESSKGCKASLNVSAGEVKVNPTDNTRFDIILQHDQHWYLKASTAVERQKWLIALGTAKARKCEFSAIQEIESDVTKCEMQSKVSELRLYCDLLSNQVMQLKEEAGTEHPDAEKLSETSSMLVATCDTFLNTLTHCMKMAEGNFLPAAHGHRKSSDNFLMALPPTERHKTRHKERHTLRSVSVGEFGRSVSSRAKDTPTPQSVLLSNPESYSVPTSPITDTTAPPLGDATKTLTKLRTSNTPMPSSMKTEKVLVFESTAPSTESSTKILGSTRLTLSSQDAEKPKREDPTVNDEKLNSCTKNGITRKNDAEEHQLTFFSAMLHSFTDIVLEEDGGVPTTPFLAACDDLLPFFDAIGSTAFAPVKMDLMGNIKKLRTKHLTNPTAFCTLQSIVKHEIDSKTTKVRNSATDALLWLKRGLQFIQKFLNQLRDGEKDVASALNAAYAATLRNFHGWVVKGIFALALKAAPYHKVFLKALESDSFPYESPNFEQVLQRDVDDYVTALGVVLNMIDSFYEQHLLDDQTVV